VPGCPRRSGSSTRVGAARQLSRGPAADPERDSWEGKAMVGNMIRVLRARMTLLAVDEAGMSTVEYSIV
jgi:hypothetical protein